MAIDSHTGQEGFEGSNHNHEKIYFAVESIGRQPGLEQAGLV
jgi:hypothetical protein